MTIVLDRVMDFFIRQCCVVDVKRFLLPSDARSARDFEISGAAFGGKLHDSSIVSRLWVISDLSSIRHDRKKASSPHLLSFRRSSCDV